MLGPGPSPLVVHANEYLDARVADWLDDELLHGRVTYSPSTKLITVSPAATAITARLHAARVRGRLP